jgi:hypothetical protein
MGAQQEHPLLQRQFLCLAGKKNSAFGHRISPVIIVEVPVCSDAPELVSQNVSPKETLGG